MIGNMVGFPVAAKKWWRRMADLRRFCAGDLFTVMLAEMSTGRFANAGALQTISNGSSLSIAGWSLSRHL